MLNSIIIESGAVGGPAIDWMQIGCIVSSGFIAFGICCGVYTRSQELSTLLEKYGKMLTRNIVGAALIGTFVSGIVLNNTARATNGEKPKPVIVVKDIEIKSYKCDHTGCEIVWTCGTNITVGVDKFIIQRSERQIPARTGWSAFEDYGESMTTNWATATPQHASDVRWKVIVRKEQE